MPDYDETRDEIEEAIFRLVRKGQVVDSGRRRWSERTGRAMIYFKILDASLFNPTRFPKRSVLGGDD
jgi:hypothetical protein